MDNHAKGVLMALSAATLWGVSGTCGQFLFQQREVSVEWLMAVRMLGAGGLLLLLAILRKDAHVWAIWRNKGDRRRLLVFGIAGMLTVQYTYFAAIKHSNAATATILQFSAPVFIAIYLAARYGRRLNGLDYLAIFLAILGTFLLVTHGDINALNISPLAFALGIASAVSLALYTLMPGVLLSKYSAVSVIGWGLFIGGVAISLINPPWEVDGVWDRYTYANSLFVVLFGTLIPFYLYLKAVQLIGGQKASLLTSAEPLSATLIAVLWLGVSFQTLDWLGAFLIVITVFLLSIGKVSPEA
ncbi:DMT family transporter [Parapedobacter sp. DT-150]|uniref:DMT family transporter n=1 Tax=Parapedobacter sp. DT-150 TaxID=3396162 RepID=UPI003F1A7C2E